MSMGWKYFEAHDRKNLDCLKCTFGRNIDIKDPLVGSEGSEEHSRESLCHLREYLYLHRENVGRNRNIKNAAGER